jgi:hypothetical protein
VGGDAVSGWSPGPDPTVGLRPQLDPTADAWLGQALAAAAADPARVRRAFPAVGRRLGRGPLDPAADPADPHAWTRDDAGRAALLRAAAGDPPRPLGDLLWTLYERGDSAERRGVLRALDVLPAAAVGAAGPALLRDALRTNDVRLVAAAAGGRGAVALLTDAELAQALLKCLFVGVPLGPVVAVGERLPPDAARMAADLVRERVAAGRDVPADAWLLLDAHPGALDAAGLPAELAAADPARRAAARRFLDSRPALDPTDPREG